MYYLHFPHLFCKFVHPTPKTTKITTQNQKTSIPQSSMLTPSLGHLGQVGCLIKSIFQQWNLHLHTPHLPRETPRRICQGFDVRIASGGKKHSLEVKQVFHHLLVRPLGFSPSETPLFWGRGLATSTKFGSLPFLKWWLTSRVYCITIHCKKKPAILKPTKFRLDGNGETIISRVKMWNQAIETIKTHQ